MQIIWNIAFELHKINIIVILSGIPDLVRCHDDMGAILVLLVGIRAHLQIRQTISDCKGKAEALTGCNHLITQEM